MVDAVEREDPLLGAALVLIAVRAAERGIEAMGVARLLQRPGLRDYRLASSGAPRFSASIKGCRNFS